MIARLHTLFASLSCFTLTRNKNSHTILVRNGVETMNTVAKRNRKLAPSFLTHPSTYSVTKNDRTCPEQCIMDELGQRSVCARIIIMQ